MRGWRHADNKYRNILKTSPEFLVGSEVDAFDLLQATVGKGVSKNFSQYTNLKKTMALMDQNTNLRNRDRGGTRS